MKKRTCDLGFVMGLALAVLATAKADIAELTLYPAQPDQPYDNSMLTLGLAVSAS